MLEQRIDHLEKILTSLEPKISELLLTTAKQADLHRLQLEIAEVKGKVEALSGRLEGQIKGVEGRLSGLDARFAALPTTWTMLGIVFTTWALGSGILIFAFNVLKR